MKWGISAFAGLNMPNIQEYIKKSADCGAKKLFTSLHIPEADNKNETEFRTIVDTSIERGMSVFVDISAKYYDLLPFDRYSDLSIRLDFGFSDEEIAELSSKHILVLNTSTLTLEQLKRLQAMNIDFSRITTCHNYYPRVETGLSVSRYIQKNQLCQKFGLEVYTFISGSSWYRPPMNEGLPTIERHRNIHPVIAAQECFALGSDWVLFSDMATNEELEMIGELQQDVWTLPVEWYVRDYHELKTTTHTNREDSGDGLLRSEHSRAVLKGNIAEENCIERKRGSITVDNQLYQRYQGELQITTKDFKSDSRVNVIGRVLDEGILLDYIKPQDRWKFQ